VECKKQERLSKDTCWGDIKTKQILALEVTDEKVHDSKVKDFDGRRVEQ